MRLNEYIKGDRTGIRARDLELDSMFDSLLSAAVDGYNLSDEDHTRILAALEKEFTSRKKRPLIPLIVGAAIATAAALFYLWFSSSGESKSGAPIVNNREQVEYYEGVNEKTDDFLRHDAENLSVRDNPAPAKVHGASAGKADSRIKEGENQIDNESNNDGSETGYANTGDNAIAQKTGAQAMRASLTIYNSGHNTDSEPGIRTAASVEYISMPKIGIRKFNEYLTKAVVRPEDGGRGEVIMTFHVNRYGRPSGIRVQGMVSKDAHREAIRLIESGPEWTSTEQTVTIGITID